MTTRDPTVAAIEDELCTGYSPLCGLGTHYKSVHIVFLTGTHGYKRTGPAVHRGCACAVNYGNWML